VGFSYNNKSLDLREGNFKKGTIIGLNHNDNTIGLGIIVEVAGDSITFESPVKSLKGINRVLFSDMEI
jgi:hypothetical protein